MTDSSSNSPLERLGSVARHALEHLKKLGVEHAEVSVAAGRNLQVSVREAAVELVKEASSSGLSVRLMRDDRVATSSTTDLAPDAVRAFLERAVEMAVLSEPDPLSRPPEASELTQSWPDLELFDPQVETVTAGRAVEMAIQAEKAAFAVDKRITASEGATVGRTSSHSVLATSGGFFGTRSGTYASLVAQAVADDEGGKKRNGFYWTGGRFFDALESPEEVGREAARRAIASIGSVKIPTGVYPIVFDADAARAIIGLVASCILGDSIYRQRSYLVDRLGTSIGSKLLNLVDDPLIPRGPGSRAFDGEGRAVRKLEVVRGGTLEHYLLDTHSARQLGMEPTGSAAGGGGVPHASPSNFYLMPGSEPPEALLAGIERGLYVHRMMGFGFDPTTGNFSRGAEGFLIENGKKTVPVAEITISRNLDELLHGIDMVANDLEMKTATASPSFRVDHMTVAGS